MKNKNLVLFAIVVLSIPSLGHQAHKHAQPPAIPVGASEDTDKTHRLKEAQSLYEKEILPIFQQKCMDCHSRKTNYPWYYNWPLARQLIDRDIRDAKSHLDMTDGFPFLSHGTPQEDLEAIREVIAENEMPPWRYRILHAEAKLTEVEKEKIKAWASTGLESLK